MRIRAYTFGRKSSFYNAVQKNQRARAEGQFQLRMAYMPECAASYLPNIGFAKRKQFLFSKVDIAAIGLLYCNLFCDTRFF